MSEAIMIQVDQLHPVSEPTSINESAMLYLVNFDPTSNKTTDNRVSMGVLTSYILGTSAGSQLKDSDLFHVTVEGGKRKRFKFSSIRDSVLGTTFFRDGIVETDALYMNRTEKDSRGMLYISDLIKYVNTSITDIFSGSTPNDTVIKDIDVDTVKFYMNYEGTKTFTFSTVYKLILGNNEITSINGDERLFIHTDTVRGMMKVDNFIMESQYSDNIIDIVTDENIAYGNIAIPVKYKTELKSFSLPSLKDYIGKELGISKYTSNDSDFAADSVLEYRTGKKYGLATLPALKKLIVPTTVRAIDTETGKIDEDGQIQLTNGVLAFETLQSFIDLRIIAKDPFSIDLTNPQETMEEGDGFAFVSNGETAGSIVWKNISFTNVKETMLVGFNAKNTLASVDVNGTESVFLDKDRNILLSEFKKYCVNGVNPATLTDETKLLVDGGTEFVRLGELKAFLLA